jgi:DNA-binding NarL/FixJ family response regulator
MKAATPIRLILADDHEIFRDGFKAMLKKQPLVELVGEASNGEELVELSRRLKPDIIVTDIKMPKMDGTEATRILSKELPSTGIIALSMIDEENLIVDMLEAGAKGYLLKNAHKDEIMEAIKSVSKDQIYYCAETSGKLAQMIARSNSIHPARKPKKPEFSQKEIAVIQCLCQEMSNKQIAETLDLSIRTIEGYRGTIQEKIGAKNSAGIVIYAIRNKIYQVN